MTVGLVFIGEWLWRNLVDVTGGSQSGRRFPSIDFRLWKEDPPFISFSTDGSWFGVELSGEAKTYFLLLLFAVFFAVVTKNIQRTRTGRSFMAIRDRDVAAEVMGVPEAKSKALSFSLSSFYAGIAGALLGAFVSRLIPESFNLFLSVQFLAILLVGGLGTITGTLLGAVFVVTLPRIVRDFTSLLADTAETGVGFGANVANVFVSTGPNDFGLVSTAAGNSPGLNVSQLNLVLYGVLLIVFLIFEPLGLYGIWIRIRNYWKGWPFTY